MPKKSTVLPNWWEINTPSATKMGRHNEKLILIWRIHVSALRLNAKRFGRSRGGETARTSLLYRGYTRHMDYEMFWMSLAGDEFVVGQMVLNCWKNISSAYISCTNTGQIRSCSRQERGMRLLIRNLGSLYIHTRRINKNRRKFPEAHGQWWPWVTLPLAPLLEGGQNYGVLASSQFLPLTQTARRSNEKDDISVQQGLSPENCSCTQVISCGLGRISYSWQKRGAELPKKRPCWIVFKREKS